MCQVRREHWIPWNWSYEWLWASVNAVNWTLTAKSFLHFGNCVNGSYPELLNWLLVWKSNIKQACYTHQIWEVVHFRAEYIFQYYNVNLARMKSWVTFSISLMHKCTEAHVCAHTYTEGERTFMIQEFTFFCAVLGRIEIWGLEFARQACYWNTSPALNML